MGTRGTTYGYEGITARARAILARRPGARCAAAAAAAAYGAY